MMLNAKKISVLLSLASTAVTVDATKVSGWLYDNLCINNCEGTSGPTSCTPDGSNAFYTPSVHTGECLLFDFCIESGHSIMSEFPGEDGRHSIVLKLVGDANTTAYELVKGSGITNAFPLVEADFDESQIVSTDADGVPSVSTVSLTYDAPPEDPWAKNPEKYYSGAPTTQAVCSKPSDGSVDDNNMCFRSDVEVSEEDDMLVIESNGCPDHASMAGGSDGTIIDENEFPCDVFDFAPGCSKEKPAGCCGGSCCVGKCGGCDACSDKCSTCSVSGCCSTCGTCCAGSCSAGGCYSKTCGTCSTGSCGASCSAGGCYSKTCGTCSTGSCGASCSAGGCNSKTCGTCSTGSCGASCSSGGCYSKTCGTCSTGSCGASCSAGGCYSKTCGTCSTGSCGATCSASNSTIMTRALEVCSATTCSACSTGCYSKTCGACSTGCYSKTCGACSTGYCSKTCGTCSTGCCSKTCSTCSTGCCSKTCSGCCGDSCSSCEGKCCSSSDSIGKYTPTFQHYKLKIPKAPGAPGDKQLLKDDVVGLMFNGVVLDSHKQTWAYDMCDGHSDENHQYHYHIPQSCYLESMGVAFAGSPNWWINDAGDQVRKFDEMAAQFPTTAPASPVIGMALDGYPIYGLYDENGDLQRSKAFGGSIDECNGKLDSQNNYGYYLSADPPFAPACLKGTKIGTFDYWTYNKACPKDGIKNTIKLLKEGDPTSTALISIPYLSVIVFSVAFASALFF